MRTPLIRITLGILTILFTAWMLTGSAAAATARLADWNFNLDGTMVIAANGHPLPQGTVLDPYGMGTFTFTAHTTGPHFFIAGLDYDIKETGNTENNELGHVHGSPLPGQSWEINQSVYSSGTLLHHIRDNGLDNENHTGWDNLVDTALAIGWEFTLDAGETAVISFITSLDAPETGFYLSQMDGATEEVFYFSSTLSIYGSPVPEPGTGFLLGISLLAAAGLGRQRR